METRERKGCIELIKEDCGLSADAVVEEDGKIYSRKEMIKNRHAAREEFPKAGMEKLASLILDFERRLLGVNAVQLHA